MCLNRFLLLLLIPLFGWAQKSQPKMNIRFCDTLVMQGKYEEAVQCLEPIYAANPQGPAYEKLLDAHLLSNDTTGALKVVRKQVSDLMHDRNTQRLLGTESKTRKTRTGLGRHRTSGS